MTDNLNQQHTFAPHDIAGMLGVSAMTVRGWADYHKAHLSEVANPTPGKPRAFTWADVEKFRQIKAWRDSGLSVEAINNTLSGNIPKAITTVTTPDNSTALQTATDAPESTPASIVMLDAMRSDIEALRAAVAESRHNQRDGVVMLGVGFVAACGLFILLLLLFILRNYL